MNDYNATLLQDEQRYEMKKEFKLKKNMTQSLKHLFNILKLKTKFYGTILF